VHDGYLGVIQGQFNKCMTPTDAPPIIAARIEYKIFVENVKELRGKMMGEIPAMLSGWLDVADQIQLRDTFMQLIQAKVDAFCRELTEIGLQRFLDMAHALKLADDQWRTVIPSCRQNSCRTRDAMTDDQEYPVMTQFKRTLHYAKVAQIRNDKYGRSAVLAERSGHGWDGSPTTAF